VALVAKDFSATVDAWTRIAKGGVENVFKQSVQDVIEIMQTPGWSVAATKHAIRSGGNKRKGAVGASGKGGNLPVDTGFLRSSLRITIGASGLIDRPEGNDYTWQQERSYTMTIAGADITQSIYAVYLAKYAGHVEYGTRYVQPRGFRRMAVQQWPQIVSQNIAKAKRMKVR
jgi:hypothetical protein